MRISQVSACDTEFQEAKKLSPKERTAITTKSAEIMAGITNMKEGPTTAARQTTMSVRTITAEHTITMSGARITGTMTSCSLPTTHAPIKMLAFHARMLSVQEISIQAPDTRKTGITSLVNRQETTTITTITLTSPGSTITGRGNLVLRMPETIMQERDLIIPKTHLLLSRDKFQDNPKRFRYLL